MIQISTQDLLLLHAYGETTPEQAARLERELADNPHLLAELNDILSMKDLLNDARLSPSATSVNIVLEHSQNTAEELHEI
ncbi:MAG: hypothetical protein JNK66_05615 [Chitinophagales bacterium]|nr:hypothetical protein [Chitinophagales bacterium]